MGLYLKLKFLIHGISYRIRIFKVYSKINCSLKQLWKMVSFSVQVSYWTDLKQSVIFKVRSLPEKLKSQNTPLKLYTDKLVFVWNDIWHKNTINHHVLLPPATKLRQGNAFLPVCDSVHRGSFSLGVICPGGSLSRGSLSGGLSRWSLFRGLCPEGFSVRETPRHTVTCGWYVLYWNAFLFY